MKKYFIIAAAALVALAACTKNEIDPASKIKDAREINFNTVTGLATKAPISGTTYSYDCPAFGVFAYYLASGDWNTAAANTSAVSYMDDVEIRFNDSKDIWAPHDGSAFVNYYWPLEGKLTFIAYSPKSAATATFSNAGLLTLTNFTVASTVADQVDLLYSSIAADKKQNEAYYTDSDNSKNSETAEEDKGVNIKFKHALSQVIFKAKTANEVYDAGLSFKVNSITVNAASTATSMTVTNPTDAQLASDITTWTEPGTNANFAVRSTDFPEAANTYLTKTLSDPIGDALLMIPVTAFAGTDPTVTVSYTLYRMSDNVDLGTKEVSIHFDDIDDVVTNWQAGKKYVYNLTIDLQKIYFNPTITDWVDGGSQDVDVPDDARA